MLYQFKKSSSGKSKETMTLLLLGSSFVTLYNENATPTVADNIDGQYMQSRYNNGTYTFTALQNATVKITKTVGGSLCTTTTQSVSAGSTILAYTRGNNDTGTVVLEVI